MRLWDVNLWVYAFRSDSPLHRTARPRFEAFLDTREAFIFCPNVASSFLRLVTNPRIFVQPSDYREAWAFVDWLEAHPASHFAEADAMTYGIFKHLCLVEGATGNQIPDAFLAALAIRHDAVLVSADKGLARWKGVELEIVE
ncbi:MAG: TA system VapC family ribonuclease toxin [Spirochaetota bacterium]